MSGWRLYVGRRYFSASASAADATLLRVVVARFISLGRGKSGGVRLAEDARAGDFIVRANARFRRAHGSEQCAGFCATDDVNPFDAALESAFGGFELENHSPGNGTVLNKRFDFIGRDYRDDFFALEDASNICEIDELVTTEICGTGGSHMVGVDVVKLIARADAKARGDRDKIALPKRFDKRFVQSRQIANKTEAARNFIVNERFCEESMGVGRGNTDSRMACRGNRTRQLLVQETGKDHEGNVARFAIRNAQPVDELARDPETFEGGGEDAATAVDDENLVALIGKDSDLRGKFANNGITFEQRSRKFDDEFHCSPVFSSSCDNRLKF